VQTPTLAMVVERELGFAVSSGRLSRSNRHVPAAAKPDSQSYKGTWFRTFEELHKSMRLPIEGVEAAQIVSRAKTGKAAIESVKAETQRMPPPRFTISLNCNGTPIASSASARRRRWMLRSPYTSTIS